MKSQVLVTFLILLCCSIVLADTVIRTDRQDKPIFADDRILIKLSSEAESLAKLPHNLYEEYERFDTLELDAIMNKVGGQKIIRAHDKVKNKEWEKRTGFNRWFIIQLSGDISILDAVKQFEYSKLVEESHPLYLAYELTEPNDDYYKMNWGHNNTAQLLAYVPGSGHTGSPVGMVGFDSDAEKAWEFTQGYGSENIIIAIIDSGVDINHQDLRLVTGYDYGDNDDNPMDDSVDPGHGTGCAGIAAAIANNSSGVAGIAGGCSIMPIKAETTSGEYNSVTITNSIIYAADHGADIISMSLGLDSSTEINSALEYAYNQGITIFAATGNTNNSSIRYPASHPLVIGVGAASPSGERKSPTSSDGETDWGSNYGVNTQDAANAVDLMAPTILPTTTVNGYTFWFNGTSCAAPYAAGVAALLLSYKPDLTTTQIREALITTATDMTIDGGIGWDRYTGYGLVNAFEALVSLFKPSAGDGSEGSPYQVASLENLYWIAHDITRWDKHYIQTADIDASLSQQWGNGWIPIGNDTFPFTGSYDGDNHLISGLYKNAPALLEVGMFGCLEGASVSDVRLTDVFMRGYRFVGGLAGKIGYDSHLDNCHVSGVVIGDESFIGGLTGYANVDCTVSVCHSEGNVTGTGNNNTNDRDYLGGLIGYLNDSAVNNSYSLCTVTGSSYYEVGGLVGKTSSSYVANCYSAGSVTGIGGNSIGGLIGFDNPASTITSCYWDINASGQTTSAGGSGRVTTQMMQQANYVGWDFTNIWQIEENLSYPHLRNMESATYLPNPIGLVGIGGNQCIYLSWECTGNPISYNVYRNGLMLDGVSQKHYLDAGVSNGETYYYYVKSVYHDVESTASNIIEVIPTPFLSYPPSSGDGGVNNPYLVNTMQNLAWIAEDASRWNKFYVQTSDINAAVTNTWSDGGWLPIGNSTTNFTGNYNGNGFSISGLYISRAGSDYQGLFGLVSGGGVQNLNLVSVNITGGNRTGALAGGLSSAANVVNCHSSGNVTGANYCGGLVGSIFISSGVSASSSACSVTGVEMVGGVVGYSHGSGIANCYSRGAVNGGTQIGGLVGSNGVGAAISSSYSTGAVTGSSYVGGLVGFSSGSVGSSYWDIEASGNATSPGGGIPRYTYDMTYPYSDSTFVDWDFSTIWIADTNHLYNGGYPYLYYAPIEPPPYLPTPVVSITLANQSILLTWQQIYGNILYLIFISDDPNGEFIYHDSTYNSQYTHYLASLFQLRLFYKVVAFQYAGREALVDLKMALRPGMPESEVKEFLKSFNRKP